MSERTEKAIRCAVWARERGVPPIGTAGSYGGFLLLEWPLPWPSDVATIPELGPIVDALQRTGIRLQLLVPRSPDGAERYCALYRKGGPDFSGYSPTRRAANASEIVTVAVDLLEGRTPMLPDTAAATDLLICTHGSRDTCCGTFGTRLALDAARSGAATLANTTVWRTSHLGGHRFAPTVLVLPHGTVWANVDLEMLIRLAADSPSVDDVADRFRGSSDLESPALQAVERAVLLERGGSLVHHARWGDVMADGAAELSVRSPDGRLEVWTAHTQPGERFPVPQCGVPLAASPKAESIIEVHDLQRITG